MVTHDLHAIADADLRWSYTDAGRNFASATIRVDVGPITGGSTIASGTSASVSGLRAVKYGTSSESIEVIMPDGVLAQIVAVGGRARYHLRATWAADDTETLASGVIVVRSAIGVAV
jgi:hypothetical protein